jgi:hypothetical protein
MKNNIKKALVTIYCGIALFLSGLILPNWSIATGVDLVFKEETLSANLDEVPLKEVLEKISREKGIWIKWKGSVLEGKVSLQFRDLYLQDGLRRILAQCNHSLVFNRAGRLIGLYIIGKGKPQTAGILTTKSDDTMPGDDKHATTPESSFKIDKGGHLHDGPIEISDGPANASQPELLHDGPGEISDRPPSDGSANASQPEL